MSEDHTEKMVMSDTARHLLDTVPVSPLPLRIIDYNQPEWLAEFNRRGERIAELEAERDRLRKALERVVKLLDRPMLKDDMCLYMNKAIRVAHKALEEQENVEKDS